MRVRRASTSWVTSFTIFALALGAIVVNHFARRTLPERTSHFRNLMVLNARLDRSDLVEIQEGCS